MILTIMTFKYHDMTILLLNTILQCTADSDGSRWRVAVHALAFIRRLRGSSDTTDSRPDGTSASSD